MKYFLHDTNSFDDEKITELFMEFGYEGLGLFYTILEKMAKQEKPVKTDVLKKQLRIGKRLTKCWCFMEEIELISSNNGETFNENILNFSEKYQIKKEKNRKKVSQWRENQKLKENVTSYVPVRNPPKVNKSKVNKSKVNKSDALHPEFVKIWEWYWTQSVDIKYNWSGADFKHIKDIINDLRSVNPDADDQTLIEIFKQILNYLKNDKFYSKKQLGVIKSQFNSILGTFKTSRESVFSKSAFD